MTETIPTDLRNTLGRAADHTAARNAAALAELGLSGEPEAPRVLPPSKRPTERFRLQREDWHTHPGAPEAVVDAWAQVVKAANVVRHAERAVDQLDADRRVESANAAAAAREALDAGRKPAPLVATDWESERLNRDALATAALGRYREVRAVYEDVARANLGAWVQNLAGMVPGATNRAREAFAVATSALSERQATVRAMLELERLRDPARYDRNTEYATRAARGALSAQIPPELIELINSDDPIVTGSWVTTPDDDDAASPPVHVRRAMDEDVNTRQLLASVEAGEDYTVTDFTRGDFEGMFPRPSDG